MPRNLDHLELPSWQQPFNRRKGGGGRAPTRPDRAEHGDRLAAEAEAISEAFALLQARPPAGIDPKLIFNIRLHPNGRIDDDELRLMGLHLVSREPNKLIVVFPDAGTVDELRRRIREYATHTQAHYANVAAIEAIEPRTPADRVGARLQREPIVPGEVALLDIAFWHSGDSDECRGWIRQITDLLRGSQRRVTDSWVGNDLCLIRAEVDDGLLELLLQIDFVRSIDRRANPVFEFRDLVIFGEPEIEAGLAVTPLDDLIGIVVIDSGVTQGHPLIGPVLGDAQSFFLGDDRAQDVDNVSGGHGTAIGGIAIYGDVGAAIQARRFVPGAALFSARVLDENLEFDPERLLEHQLEEAVDYFIHNYPSVRVINLSLGNADEVFTGGRQSGLAAAIDELAYRYRERELLFVISTGNNTTPDGEAAMTGYPGYLSEPEARLIDPATAAIALTVGGVAYGPGLDPQEGRRDGVETLVAQNRGWPSPFTRVGPGVDGAIKPDLVDFAGDIRFERGMPRRQPAQHAGLPSTSKSFAPPDGRLFRTVAGTSYAAPRIANLAARLYREFPGATSNLVRALIAASARVPDDRPAALIQASHLEDVWRIYGYGLADFDRARFSDENDLLLLAEGEIQLDSFQLFSVPSLPPTFLSTQGHRELAVTLAFDPPTRHTRSDYYLGVRMYAHLFRNLAPADLAQRLKALTSDEREALGDDESSLTSLPGSQRVNLLPGVNVRRAGTLQRGVAQVGRSNWQYDGADLTLAVICQRTWSPIEIDRQRFAVVVSLSHSDAAVQLHTHIRQRARLWQQVRVRV